MWIAILQWASRAGLAGVFLYSGVIKVQSPLQFAAALAGYRDVAIACGVLWALMTVRFCLCRLSGTSHSPDHIVEMVFTSLLIPPLAVFWRLMGAVRYRVFFL